MTAQSPADRQRAYRARQGAKVGAGPGPAPTAACGSVSAYKRHLRHGEALDDACRLAWAEYQRERYAARKAQQ